MDTKNYIVIGGSRGIGAAVVSNLLLKGADVRYSSRSGRPLSGKSDGRIFEFDAAREEFPKEVIANPLDGLVYCPGTINLKPFQRLTGEDFRNDLQTNLIGAVTAVKACLPALKKKPPGDVYPAFQHGGGSDGHAVSQQYRQRKGSDRGVDALPGGRVGTTDSR